MIKLFDVNEQNWLDIAGLTVRDDQRRFLDSALGIVARGYAYRSCRASVIGIAEDGQIIGVALIRGLDETPACYDLQQFMIDRRFQGRGLGTEALCRILTQLAGERRYDCVEVCVHRDNRAALRMYESVGFIDTGYVDEDAPDCRCLVYRFPDETDGADRLISDFSDPQFRQGFRQYFDELGISVSDWDALFREMDGDGDNAAFIRSAPDGRIVGFLQFRPAAFTSWFFEETCGFIREFWVAPAFRGSGHGSALIARAERYFLEQGMYTAVLTTDTAPDFYTRHGYVRAPGCRAKNGDEVFIKRLA
ncbi:MAG: GNAT family N-acetyltransferase [Ruminococcaceae bacterium]|nr:GNAT family N-acetyltransferase [Oscillospiraceae bacterium]